MPHEKTDNTAVERQDNDGRFDFLDPDVMWDAAATPEARIIIEIGAGTGMFAFRFAELAPDAQVYAADVEPQMVRWMFEHRPAALSGRLHPLLAEEAKIPLPTGEADLAVMISVHRQLADYRGSYCEALRLLRIGGTLLVADWRPEDPESGPPQPAFTSTEQITEHLSTIGFFEIASHTNSPQYSLISARKAAVCGTGIPSK